jgi:hypothetical protein
MVMVIQWGANGWPEEMTPQKNAQMGANQVTGFKSSRQVLSAGTVSAVGDRAANGRENPDSAGMSTP